MKSNHRQLSSNHTTRQIRETENKTPKSKKREDRQLCTLFFCQEVGCSVSFETLDELEEHELVGNHVFATELSNIDKVKKMFVRKMKGNLEVHMQRLGANNVEISLDEECNMHVR